MCIKTKKCIDSFSYKIHIDDIFNKKKSKVGAFIEDYSDFDNNIILEQKKLPSPSYNTISLSQNQEKQNDLCLYNNSLTIENEDELTNEQIFNQIQKMVKENYNEDIINLNDDNISVSSLSSISSSQFFDNNLLLSKQSTNTNKNISKTQSAPKPFSTLSNLKYSSFAFINGGSSTHINFNMHITSQLEKIMEFHSNEGNVFESLAYRKAIGQIKKYPKKIVNFEDIKKVKGVGVSIGEKIKEIILTGKCRKGNLISNDSKNKSIKQLMSVYGIGLKQANEFYRKGIHSIEELKKISSELPLVIQKGLEYYEDINIKIPREEIEEIYEVIKKELYTILPKEVCKAEVCGSFRRGKALCGDIDVLITRTDEGQVDGILPTLVEGLMKKKLIVEILSLGDRNMDSNRVFMGICVWKSGINRRLDIKVYNKEEFPFAVLYFTGNAYFNRSMRLFAKKKKMHLSDKELSYRNTGMKIHCANEEDIFKALEIDYKEPKDREI